jgi:hypothetical protein
VQHAKKRSRHLGTALVALRLRVVLRPAMAAERVAAPFL